MRWKLPQPAIGWHRWFAWYPVRITVGRNAGEMVWLEWIERNDGVSDLLGAPDFRTASDRFAWESYR